MKKKYLTILIVTFVLVMVSSVRASDLPDSPNILLTHSTTTPPTDPWVTSGNGEKVNVSAGSRVQIRTMSKNHLRLQVNECTQICINESKDNPVGSIQNQTRAVNRFLHIIMNGTCAMNATMYRNYTNNELEGLGNVSKFRWAWYNEANFQWEYAHQNWVDIYPEGATVYCNTSHFSVWTILAPNLDLEKNPTPGTPFNSQNGTGFAIQAGNLYQIKTQSGFSLQLQLNQTVEVTITEFEETPKIMTQARHRIRTQTMEVHLNASDVQIRANFSYTFNNQIKNQLGIQNTNKLKFMFYNETSKEWETPKHQWLEEETLYCNTTHFSLWTIAEEEVMDSPTTGFSFFLLLAIFIPIVLLKKRRNI